MIDVPRSAVPAVESVRKDWGMIAKDWAFLLGVERSHYSEFVSGKRVLPVKAMQRAFALGVPAVNLFMGDRDELKPKNIERGRKNYINLKSSESGNN